MTTQKVLLALLCGLVGLLAGVLWLEGWTMTASAVDFAANLLCRSDRFG